MPPGSGRASLADLEAAIGHRFGNRDLLSRALTHYSHVYEAQGPLAPRTAQLDNEQFEFLGDAILGFVASDLLLHSFPESSEGKLSERKSHLVSASHLYEAASKLDLGRFLFLGKGEETSGGRAKRGMLADALEALIAAVYLDAGIEAARRFICAHILGQDVATGAYPEVRPDYKTRLQELSRARGLPLPQYELIAEDGPAHARTFTVRVAVGEDSACGEGSTKKGASQAAAKLIYEQLSINR